MIWMTLEIFFEKNNTKNKTIWYDIGDFGLENYACWG